MNPLVPQPTKPPPLFTARQLAGALGVTKRAVLQQLAGIPARGGILVRGLAADAWALGELPAGMIERLQAEAAKHGFRDVTHLLTQPVEPWQPKIPLAELAPECLAQARQLQEAMRPILERLNDLSISEGELCRMGLREYLRAFGVTITERHWRRLFARTLDRAKSDDAFDRLELFLPDRLKRAAKPAAPCLPAEAADLCAPLNDPILALMSDKEREPLSTRKRRVLEAACILYESLTTRRGYSERHAKALLTAHLATKAPLLIQPRQRPGDPVPIVRPVAHLPSVRRLLDRKLDQWRAAGRTPWALEDGRQERSGNFRMSEAQKRFTAEWQRVSDEIVAGGRPELKGDLKLWLEQIKQTEGDCAWAFRNCHQKQLFSAEMVAACPWHPRQKTRVPKFLLAIGRSGWNMVEKLHLGEREFDLTGPNVIRHYKNVFALDWITADDQTPDCYVWDFDKATGKPFTFRSQTLIFCDCRTEFVFLIVAIWGPQYNTRHIFGGYKRVLKKWGIPHRGTQVERGLWDRNRLVKGRELVDLTPEQTLEGIGRWASKQQELGLRKFGLEFKHLNRPKGKIIERVIGWFQKQLREVPGCCGPDEMHKPHERLRRLLLDIDAGRVDPNGKLLHFSQWQAKLVELADRYNNTPQFGKLLDGQTPLEGFVNLQRPGDPPMQLDASCEWLLNYSERPERVTRKGITITVPGGTYEYCDHPLLAFYINKQVSCRFDPEDMSVLTVMPPDRSLPFTIPVRQEDSFHDADLSHTSRVIARFQRPQREVYLLMKGGEEIPKRITIPDPRTTRTGEIIEAQRSEVTAQLNKRQRNTAQVIREANTVGVTPAALRNDEGSASRLAQLGKFLAGKEDQ